MDPLTTSVIAKTADDVSEVAKEGAKGFISTVLRAPGEALGGLFADSINARRHANLVKIAIRAKEQLDAAGVSPKEVPLSIIHPALQAASLEEEPDMQEAWSTMLANAADPREVKPVSRSFPGILKQLSAREVKLLDTLYQIAQADRRRGKLTNVGFTPSQLRHAFSFAGLARFNEPEPFTLAVQEDHAEEIDADAQDLAMCLDSLRRHELVIQNIDLHEKKDSIRGSTRGVSYSLPNNKYSISTTYSLTHLGVGFVSACQAPQPSGESEKATK